MPFEDFYKAADHQSHRWRLCLLAAFFLIVGYFGLPFFVTWLVTPKPPAKPPLTRSLRGTADALCISLPKPEQFLLTGVSEEKIIDGAARVVYTFHTERSFEEVMPQFLIWFDEQNWERAFDEAYERSAAAEHVFNFRSRGGRVSILYFDPRKSIDPDAGARYEIVCTVE